MGTEHQAYYNRYAGIKEHHYALACSSGHTAFCRAYEKWLDFKPFILKDQSRAGRRLYPGMKDFWWQGARWKISSFGPKHAYLNLIQNKNDERQNGLNAGASIYAYGSGSHRIIERNGATLTIDETPHDSDSETNIVIARCKVTLDDVKAFNTEAKEAFEILSPLDPGGYFSWDYAFTAKRLVEVGLKAVKEHAEDLRKRRLEVTR